MIEFLALTVTLTLALAMSCLTAELFAMDNNTHCGIDMSSVNIDYLSEDVRL